MTPTMSEYFERVEELALRSPATRRRRRASSAPRRLQDIADILAGLELVYANIEPTVAEAVERRRPSRPAVADRAARRSPSDLREREARGKKFTPEQADTLGSRGAVARRGHRGPGLAGRGEAGHRHRVLTGARGRWLTVRRRVALAVAGERVGAATGRGRRPSSCGASGCSPPRRSCCSATAPPRAARARRGRPTAAALAAGLRAGAPAQAAAVPAGAAPTRARGPRPGRRSRSRPPAAASRAALLRGAAVTARSPPPRRGDAARRARWLLLRDFRTATRFTRPAPTPPSPSTDLAAQPCPPEQRAADGAEGPPRRLPGASPASCSTTPARRASRASPRAGAEMAAQAAGYWPILAERYRAGPRARRRRRRRDAFTALARGGRATTTPAWPPGRRARSRRSSGFTAAPFTAAELSRRAQQLLRFVSLVPVEYDRGGQRADRVTLDFEIQEAVGVPRRRRGRVRRPPGHARPAATARARRPTRARLGAHRRRPARRAVSSPAAPERRREGRDRGDGPRARATSPDRWEERTDESRLRPDRALARRARAAVAGGQYAQAEQARLEVYAFFEFGPERRLRSFDPGPGRSTSRG